MECGAAGAVCYDSTRSGDGTPGLRAARARQDDEDHMNRRDFLLATSATALGGCVSVGGAPGPPAPPPQYGVGDRWIYRARDGYRQPVVWDETHEVTSVGAGGIEFRVTQKGPQIDDVRTERLIAPGIVAVGAVFDNETRVFSTPLRRYEFPLTPGASWRQSADNYNETLGKDDPLLRYVTVGGWEPVTTPAGSFDAIRMREFMQLNLDDPFRHPTQCNYEIWWAPAVGAPVREMRYATYREKGDMRSAFEFRSQDTVLELVSYRRGAP